ncbi:MAG: hypothetical protein AVDCRST_MAG93-4206, partial [uncultured Chloroflexia bacterium]
MTIGQLPITYYCYPERQELDLRQIYQQQYGRQFQKETSQTIQEMVDWLSTPGSGIATRD